MLPQRAPDIYVALLQPLGYGYPLWLPGPLENLPNDYIRGGTQIGDLGYLADDGGFVYLFNVGKDASDPVNLHRTPPGFVPLSGIHERANIQLRSYRHQKNARLEAFSKEKKSIGGNISAEAPIAPVAPGTGLNLEFTSSSTQAAYLVLPDGGKHSKYEYPDVLEQYASDHAHSWYKHFNGQGRQIRNGMLYLVTGWNKCRSWANACYSHAVESKAASLKLLVSAGGANTGGTLHYNWEVEADSSVHQGSYPHESPAPDSPETTQNQTIFLHGYSISVCKDSSLRVKLGIKNPVEAFKIDEMTSKPPRIESWVPYAAKQSKGTGSGTAQGISSAGTKRGTARPLNFDDSEVEGSSYDDVLEPSEGESETGVLLMDIPYGHTTMQADALVQQLPGRGKIINPSALINEYILHTYPDATVALTHDDFEWRGMENNVRNPLNVMELAKYAIDNNLVSINESETASNAWVAKRQDTDIGGQPDIYFRGTLPKDTLSAFTEIGLEESSIEVPMQRSYSGRNPVIPSHLTDTHCATLGVQGVLDQLNTTLGTSHTLHTAHSSSTSTASPGPSSAASIQDQDQDQLSLLSILEDFIERNYDFGTAYALLRPVWNTHNPSNELRRREGEDMERRQKALVGNRIVDPNLTPRRVWDLYSNRVVPSWITDRRPMPISHVWVDEKDRMNLQTPINGYEWPVPIPNDTNLNLIRIEMLNLGAEYVWLHELCLRQKGGPREDLRMEEWRLDVPTIGGMYNGKVVIYLSGLGRPLRLKDSDLDSDRSWFRCAWTLQLVGCECIIAGDTPDGPMHAQQIDDGNYETALLIRLHKELNSVKRHPDQIFTILGDMQKRVSTNPVDRVAALAFPLRLHTIPAYHESESLEDAWTALVNIMNPYMRAHFLLVYPGVGLGGKKWRPTWHQVMTETLPKDVDNLQTYVHHDDKLDQDFFDGYCIEKGLVQGLNVGSAEGCDRWGELVVEATDGIKHKFKIHVTHQFLIPEDMYTLLGDISLSYWAIGRRLPAQRFKKESVIMMDNWDEAYRLWDLSLAARFILV